jgi:hypothetical protein
MWLKLMERFAAEMAENIERDRAAGFAPPGSDTGPPAA